MVKNCVGCKPHPFQDKRYGNGNRVMNPVKAGKGESKKYRCTVCDKVS